MKTTRVLIAWEMGADRDAIWAALNESGAFAIVGETESADKTVALARSLAPDVILIGYVLPDKSFGVAAARNIMERSPVPVVILSHVFEPDMAGAALEAGACGYLLLPIDGKDYAAAIEMAIRRYNALRLAIEEMANLRDALETRKMVERAKGILEKHRKPSGSADIPPEFQELVTSLVANRAKRQREGFDD